MRGIHQLGQTYLTLFLAGGDGFIMGNLQLNDIGRWTHVQERERYLYKYMKLSLLVDDSILGRNYSAIFRFIIASLNEYLCLYVI